MKKIEVKILNPESIDQAEKLMVCAARLTQRGHQISCLDDFMDLYEKPYQRCSIVFFVSCEKTFLKNFAFWVRVFSIFCTYISEGVFKPHFNKSREKVQTKCTIPQNESHSSSSGCGKTPAGGSGARQ